MTRQLVHRGVFTRKSCCRSASVTAPPALAMRLSKAAREQPMTPKRWGSGRMKARETKPHVLLGRDRTVGVFFSVPSVHGFPVARAPPTIRMARGGDVSQLRLLGSVSVYLAQRNSGRGGVSAGWKACEAYDSAQRKHFRGPRTGDCGEKKWSEAMENVNGLPRMQKNILDKN